MNNGYMLLLLFSLHAGAAASRETFDLVTGSARQDSTIVQMLSEVKESTVTANIDGLQRFGSRYWNYSNRQNVFNWVHNRFLQIGITDVVVDSFLFNGTWQQNIIASIEGTTTPMAEIIVGAHLDSYSVDSMVAPGADDNASGMSAVFELARVVVSANYHPNTTFRFIGFAAEEAGLKGSVDYAQKAQQQGRDIKFMLNFDMIGYRDQSSDDKDCYAVWYPGSESFCELYSGVAEEYTSLTPIMTSQYQNSSDSWSFYHNGFNALFLIERDFNPFYHQPYDWLSELDIPYACEIVKSGLATTILLDKTPSAPSHLTAQAISNGVALAWYRSQASDLSGYNVYRRSLSETGYSRLNAQPFTDTTWIDTALSAGIYLYRVSGVDMVGLESSLSDSVQASPLVDVQADISFPKEYRLEQNYPNPFNPTTVIRYHLPVSGWVTLIVYNVVGQEVTRLVNEKRDEGWHEARFDAMLLPSGVYYYRLRSSEFTATKRMVILR